MVPLQTTSDIPLLGLGTYQLEGRACVETIHRAWELGYRHFDTADVYGNHIEVGEALKGRDGYFLTSKLFINDLTKERVAIKVSQFLKELAVDAIDLLLIHWPNSDVPLAESIEAMLACRDQGLVKAIGVSNFVRFHLEEMAPYLSEIATNQVEMHPYLQRQALCEAYRAAGIGMTAYRPIAKGAFNGDATLEAIGTKHGKSASQIALKWLLQRDIVAIPKAGSQKHLEENIDLFDFTLDDDDLAAIAALDQSKRYCTPDNLPVYDD